MNGHDLDGIYSERVWSWDWLGRPLGIHPLIRPADVDGWIHQGGELLHLEGKVTRAVPTFTDPQRYAVREAGNLTIVLLHADSDHWSDHRPSRLRGYQILPSREFPWQGRTYQRLSPSLSDDETLRTAALIICGWCWWAGTRNGRRIDPGDTSHSIRRETA